MDVALITHAEGAHVSAYLQALAVSDDCSRVVLADPDGRWEADARRVLGDKLVRVFRQGAEALGSLPPATPKLALVTMEARLAPPLIDAALDAHWHVFAEKPACVRVDDFVPLVRKADSKHLNLTLALANRLNPEIVAARRLIADDAIGKLYGLEMHLVADQTRLTRAGYHQQWMAHKQRAGGGHLIWLGIHWLDLAMHLTGQSIVAAAGFTANVGGQPIDVEDSAAAALRFEGGALGTLTSGYYLKQGYHSHLKIWGAAGWIQLEPQAEQPLHWQSTRDGAAAGVQAWQGSKEPRGYTPFVAAVLHACRRRTAPPISNADGLRALQTVHAIYRAATDGRTQELGDED